MATAPNVAPGNNEGFDLQSSGFQSWSDIAFNPRDGGIASDSNRTAEGNNNRQGKSGNTSAGAQKEKPKGKKLTKEFQDEDVYGPRNMNSWAAIKEYDDESDRQWFKEENERLAEVYGGNFIYAKYRDSQPGRIGYYCQLCSAEMNARKSLELHCNGMKHLKKKDQWEKGEQDQADYEGNNSSCQHQQSMRDPYRPPPRSWFDRGQPRGNSSGGRKSHVEPRPYRGTPSPQYRKDNRGHLDRRDDHSRYSDHGYDDYYRKEPMPYRPPYDRDPYDGRRGSPDVRHDYAHQPGPARRDAGDRYSRDRFNPYGRQEAPPPPVISGSPKVDRDHRKAPHPPAINDVNLSAQLFEGISDGSCSELLRKLSVCRVKNPDDTALATNVANFLVMSLREYYSKSGPPTIVHVLDEIILKINIMKGLQK